MFFISSPPAQTATTFWVSMAAVTICGVGVGGWVVGGGWGLMREGFRVVDWVLLVSRRAEAATAM